MKLQARALFTDMRTINSVACYSVKQEISSTNIAERVQVSLAIPQILVWFYYVVLKLEFHDQLPHVVVMDDVSSRKNHDVELFYHDTWASFLKVMVNFANGLQKIENVRLLYPLVDLGFIDSQRTC